VKWSTEFLEGLWFVYISVDAATLNGRVNKKNIPEPGSLGWRLFMVKVMLVEDDPTMFQLLSTLFTLEGFEVASLGRDENILASVKKQEPDVILLDVHLRVGAGKEINGFELLSQIRSDDAIKDKKVIISSGIDFRIKSKEVGSDGFILKPFMPDELIDMIKSLVDRENN
jgi:DNA-binding response OmpR family regulator